MVTYGAHYFGIFLEESLSQELGWGCWANLYLM